MKRLFYKVCDYYSYLLIFLIFMGQAFLKFKINNTNFNISRCLMLLVFILLPLGVIIDRKKIKIKDRGIKYILLFLLIWAIYSIFTVVWCKDIEMYIITNFFIITGVANIFFLTFFTDIQKNYKKYFFIMQLAIFINCIYYFIIRKNVIGGFYHNINDLATVITFILPITIYMLFNSKKAISIAYNIVFFVAYYYAYILINSRANILGMYIGIFLALSFIGLKNKDKILKDYKLKLITGFSLVLVSILMINSFNQNLGIISSSPVDNKEETILNQIKSEYDKKSTQTNKIKNINDLSEEEIKEIKSKHLYTSNEIRINLIYNSFDFLKKDYKFLTGIGTGNTIYYFKNFSKHSTNFEYSVHNYWIEILLTNGIFIFVGYIILNIIIVIKLLKNIDISKNIQELFSEKDIIYIVFMLSFVFSSISSSSMLTREWIWIALGFVIYHINLPEKNRK